MALNNSFLLHLISTCYFVCYACDLFSPLRCITSVSSHFWQFPNNHNTYYNFILPLTYCCYLTLSMTTSILTTPGFSTEYTLTPFWGVTLYPLSHSFLASSHTFRIISKPLLVIHLSTVKNPQSIITPLPPPGSWIQRKMPRAGDSLNRIHPAKREYRAWFGDPQPGPQHCWGKAESVWSSAHLWPRDSTSQTGGWAEQVSAKAVPDEFHSSADGGIGKSKSRKQH